MEITTQGILSLFQTTKEQRQEIVQDLIDRLDNGEIDPLQAHFQVKAMEDIVKSVTENKYYRDHVLDAAQKYGQKRFDYQAASFEIKEVGSKYDYTNCGDPIHQQLEQAAKSATAAQKQREKFLQTLPLEGMDILVPDTGEMVRIYPPSKSSTTSVAVTLK